MYIPSSNAEPRPEVIFEFIDAHPLGTLVTSSPTGELFASHLPWLVDRTRGELGTLRAHLARANPHHRLARASGGGGEALVIFTGPDAYITPTWYAAKAEHGRVVPTWNYVAVHVYGTFRFIEDPAILRDLVESLTTRDGAAAAVACERRAHGLRRAAVQGHCGCRADHHARRGQMEDEPESLWR